MTSNNVLLVAAVAAVLAAGGYRLRQHSDPVRKSRARTRAGALTVGSLLDPEYNPSRALEEAQPGHVRFRVGDEESVRGIAAAAICPLQEGRPAFRLGENVSATQIGGRLMLDGWVKARNPDQEQCLLYALWIDGPQGLEWRTGWARLNVVDLSLQGIEVEALVREAIQIMVVTENGDPVPGALLAVDEGSASPGDFYQYAFTNARGRMRLSGLTPGRTWKVSLPAGVGPRRVPIETQFTTPREEVTLTVPLTGTWTFVKCVGMLPFSGASLQLDGIQQVSGGGAAMWAVSPWLGPGQGPWTPMYLMHRAGSELPDSIGLYFRTFEPLVVDPRSEQPIRLQFVLRPRRAEAQDDKAEGCAAGER